MTSNGISPLYSGMHSSPFREKKEGRYCIYLRKSQFDKDGSTYTTEDDTLSKHRFQLLSFADANGYEISEIYHEVASGDSIDSRPEMQRLLKDVRKGMWTGVLCMDVTRLSRGSTLDQGVVLHAFAYSKPESSSITTSTLIITPAKVYNLSKDDDRQYFEMGLLIARMEHANICARFEMGKRGALARGCYIARRAPLGYTKVAIDKKTHTLIPDDDAGYVRSVFQMTLDGKTPNQIAAWLDSIGVPPRGNAESWPGDVVKHMLRNETYIGKVRWDQTSTIKEVQEDGSIIKKRIYNEEYTVIDGMHEPIVDIDVFNAVQVIVGKVTRNTKKRELTNPLAGILVCGAPHGDEICGRSLIMTKEYDRIEDGKVRHVPRRIRHSKRRGCTNKSMNFDELLEIVIEAIKKDIADIEYAITDEGMCAQIASVEREVESLRRNIAETDSRLTGLYEFLESGTYTREEYSSRKKLLEERRDTLQLRMVELYKMIATHDDLQEKRIMLHDAIDILVSDMTAKEQNNLLKNIIDRIEYVNTSENGKNDKVNIKIYLV